MSSESRGGGARENIGANEFAREMFRELLSIYGQGTSHEVGSRMELNEFEYSTCQKVPSSVMTCLYYSNIYDLELYMDKGGYKGIRWTRWSTEPELKFNWTDAKRGGPIRDDDGDLRPLVLFRLRQMVKECGDC